MKQYDAENSREPKCLECGGEIEYARPNKKFCCERCKNHYNNRLKAYRLNLRYKVDSAIERNYSILCDLLSDSRTAIQIGEAMMLGFNPSYVTSSIKSGRITEYCCYDISFRISDTKIFNIHRLCINLQTKLKKP